MPLLDRRFAYQIKTACYTSAAIVQDSDQTPTVVPVRTLHGFERISAPGETVTWNGLNDSGSPVAPGTYLAQIQAKASPDGELINYAVGRITVTA
jgi:hypothetical protein